MRYPPKSIGLRHIDWVGLIVSTDLPSLSKLLAYQLASYMNSSQDVAWPSQARLITETSMSKGSLNNHLKLLESEGWLQRQSGNHSTTTRYIIAFPKQLEKVVHDVNRVVHQMDEGSPPDGLGVVQEMDEGSPPDGLGVVQEMDTNIQLNIQSNIQDNKKEKPKPSVSGDTPYQKIIDIYHKILPELPSVAKLTTKRKAQIKQRHNVDLSKSIENWENFFDYVSQSDFLMGRVQPINGRKPFRADIEWLTNETNFTKIAEDKYHV